SRCSLRMHGVSFVHHTASRALPRTLMCYGSVTMLSHGILRLETGGIGMLIKWPVCSLSRFNLAASLRCMTHCVVLLVPSGSQLCHGSRVRIVSICWLRLLCV